MKALRPEIKAVFATGRMDWATPWDFFQEQTAKYGAFDLDVCATAENAKCRKYFSLEDDALSRPWKRKFERNSEQLVLAAEKMPEL